MKTKKGISPLIATVLLIVLSVALAAMVMTWVLDLTRGATDEANRNIEQQQKCSALDFEITNTDCSTGEITVQSNSNIDIANVTVRVYKGTDITVVNGGGISAIANAHYTADLAGASKVDAIAFVKSSSGGSIPCKDAVQEYATDCA